MITEFTAEVMEKMKYYVYRLIDPRNGETFYVGKGQGNRVFQHIRDEIDDNEKKIMGDGKIGKIREIRQAGLEVLHIIHRHGMNESVALEVESAVIDAFPGTANLVRGIGSSRVGVMSAEQIQRSYEAEEADFNNGKYILINVNRSFPDERNLYDATRFCWRINIDRAKRAEAVLSVQRGLILGAFKVEEWLPATKKNFPSMVEELPERYGFIGEEVTNKYPQFFNKRIPEKYLGGRGKINPIRYTY